MLPERQVSYVHSTVKRFRHRRPGFYGGQLGLQGHIGLGSGWVGYRHQINNQTKVRASTIVLVKNKPPSPLGETYCLTRLFLYTSYISCFDRGCKMYILYIFMLFLSLVYIRRLCSTWGIFNMPNPTQEETASEWTSSKSRLRYVYVLTPLPSSYLYRDTSCVVTKKGRQSTTREKSKAENKTTPDSYNFTSSSMTVIRSVSQLASKPFALLISQQQTYHKSYTLQNTVHT